MNYLQFRREEVIHKPIPAKFQRNVHPYHSKEPTDCMVKVDGKLRRVYSTCYGNSPSLWIIVNREKVYVSIY